MFKRDRKRVLARTDGASKTEQKWRDRQDVNSIVARCLRGDNSGLKTCGFNFADISEMPSDLQSALNRKIEMEKVFDTLPEEAKKRWKTPSEFISAIGNENEKPFFEKFGLLKTPEKALEPVKVEVINITKDNGGTATAAV